MTFRIRNIEAFHGKQVILWLEDETTHSSTKSDGQGEWCVRLTVDEAPQVIAALNAAYSQTMQHALIDVAAGGCRTCNNTRRVNRAMFDLKGTSGDPCPVCIPRAEERIRKAVMLKPKDRQ
jgi:hypothetical protein